MRALIIITLIVLILAVYFRYENFQMNGDKLIPRFTTYKKLVPNYNIGRNKNFGNFLKMYQSNGKFLKGKNFILPGTTYMPIAGSTLFTRKFLPYPKISYFQE
tara:strand:+ start:1388 stop:1696 length:309 start_codon:yes stop_codon:yes gene_type:complete